MNTTESKLIDTIASKGALFMVLLDPDKETSEKLVTSGVNAAKQGADAILIGGSFIGNGCFPEIAAELKKELNIPLILFPGGASQVIPGPDAILFTTLVSGRNPQYLIEEQVKGAMIVKALGMEAIPTAYMLIESGRTTAVEYISNTKPIPADKPSIAAAHALAAEMMGMRWVYLEGGSGAKTPVPVEMIAAVKKTCGLRIITGGGITSPREAEIRVKAGADAIVVGTVFERDKDSNLLKSFSDTIHNN